jgi:hypothetical protein
VEELTRPPALTPVIAPLLDLLGPINRQLELLDKELEQIVAANEHDGRDLPQDPSAESATLRREASALVIGQPGGGLPSSALSGRGSPPPGTR